MRRHLLAIPLSVGLMTLSAAAAMAELQSDHWAYQSIQRVQQDGVFEGLPGRLDGNRPVDRFEAAVLVQRMLKRAANHGVSNPDRIRLQALANEFADDLAGVQSRVETLEKGTLELLEDIHRLDRGTATKRGRKRPAKASGDTGFSALLSVGLVATDDGVPSNVPAGGVTVPRTRYSGSPDQTFFTLPRAAFGFDARAAGDVQVHLHADYATDRLNPSGTGSTGVSLNEAYLVKHGALGEVDVKAGGFALPFQSWEIDGPFRTATRTITPSALSTFLEGIRPVGVEFYDAEAPSDEVRWKLGIFTGAELPSTGAVPLSVSAMSDAAAIGALGASRPFDKSIGFYFDLEGQHPHGNLGWRVGWYSRSGDPSALAPRTATIDLDGFTLGAWHKFGKSRVMAQYLDLDTEAGGGGANDTQNRSWYLMFDWEVAEDTRVAIRYDDWRNKSSATPATGTDGTALTLAVSRVLNEGSRLQFEYLLPDDGGLAAPGARDYQDDLLQLRFTVDY